MREQVCLIINEIEANKEAKSQEIKNLLEKSRISVGVLKPTENIADVLASRKPEIVVLDYLLGNIGTALDLLPNLNNEETRAILWTDEPSVSVAVEAMKLGAIDYIQFGSLNDTKKLFNAISDQLTKNLEKSTKASKVEDSMVGHSKPYLKALSDSVLASKEDTACLCILGEPGTGKTALAKHIHSLRNKSGEFFSIDYDTWLSEPESLFDKNPGILSYRNTVFIDKISEDDLDLIELVDSKKNVVWKDSSKHQPLLIIGTSSSKLAKVVETRLKSRIVELPKLIQRKEDIGELVLNFISKCSAPERTKKLFLNKKVIEWVNQQSWPQNIRQLKSVLISSVYRLAKTDEDIIETLSETMLDWERNNAPQDTKLSLDSIKQALLTTNGSQRQAAILLNTNLSTLRKTIAQSEVVMS